MWAHSSLQCSSLLWRVVGWCMFKATTTKKVSCFAFVLSGKTLQHHSDHVERRNAYTVYRTVQNSFHEIFDECAFANGSKSLRHIHHANLRIVEQCFIAYYLQHPPCHISPHRAMARMMCTSHLSRRSEISVKIRLFSYDYYRCSTVLLTN